MATKTTDTTKKIAANNQLRTRRVITFTSLPSSDAPYGIGSVESVERDAGVGGRWQCHQDAGHDEEESCKQPATSTTSHNPHLPPTTRIEELTSIRRGRNIGLDGGSRRGPRASGTLDTAGAASPGASVHAR